MKTIDTKSLLLGIAATCLVLSLTSSKTAGPDETTEFVGSPAGLGIYNKNSRTLYMYKMWNGNLKSTPSETFKVAESGASLEEVK